MSKPASHGGVAEVLLRGPPFHLVRVEPHLFAVSCKTQDGEELLYSARSNFTRLKQISGTSRSFATPSACQGRSRKAPAEASKGPSTTPAKPNLQLCHVALIPGLLFELSSSAGQPRARRPGQSARRWTVKRCARLGCLGAGVDGSSSGLRDLGIDDGGNLSQARHSGVSALFEIRPETRRRSSGHHTRWPKPATTLYRAGSPHVNLRDRCGHGKRKTNKTIGLQPVAVAMS